MTATDAKPAGARLTGDLVGATSFETAPMMTRIAERGDIDQLGHVNNAVYLTWAQDIAVAHWRAVAPAALIESRIWVVLRHEIDYREQVLEGETVDIRTWLGRARGARFERHVDIRKAGATKFSAKILSDWCLLDAKSRKPLRVGSEIFTPFGI